MRYLLKAAQTAVAVGDSLAVAGEVNHAGGDLMFYASGTFTTAVLMYSPAKGLPFVPLHTLNAVGAAKVFAGPGFLRGVITGTPGAPGANVLAG